MTKPRPKTWLLTVIGYGALAALVLICLMVLRYSLVTLSWEAELYAGAAATVFLLLGWWVGKQKSPTAPPQSGPKEPLSPREADILSAVSQGSSNQEIAESLNISLSTVKTHLSNIYSKLGVKRRTQAVAAAQKLKILS